MNRDDLKIGIALSGGGLRAAAFHLGVLGRLAAENLLEQISCISTVSGGTLIAGLLYAINGQRWPDSNESFQKCLPQARSYLISSNIQLDALIRLCWNWHLLRSRPNILAKSFKYRWNITGLVKDLPENPHWFINATTYESGKNWRITPKRMGDYVLGYVDKPDFPLADAMAASAAYPVYIGPLKVRTEKHEWFKYEYEQGNKKKISVVPNLKYIHLWDGGLYDNLGVEALFKMQDSAYRDDMNFLIVSDASDGLAIEESRIYRKRIERLTEIATDQIRSLRSRSIVSHFVNNPNRGVYLQIGNDSRYILRQGKRSDEEILEFSKGALDRTTSKEAAQVKTSLWKLPKESFELLYQHGWEVANFTFLAHCPALTGHIECPTISLRP